jgi:hypothetical protein
MKKLALSAVALFLLGASAQAGWYNWRGTWVNLEGDWVGTGQNEAVLVIDFGSTAQYYQPGDPTFAFGYRWSSGTRTARNALDEIDAAFPGLTITYAPSLEVNEVSYGTFLNVGASLSEGFWQMFSSGDGRTWGDYLPVAPSSWNLGNGAWNGYALSGITTDTPTSPLPEPGAAALLGIGACVLAGWRRFRGRPA